MVNSHKSPTFDASIRIESHAWIVFALWSTWLAIWYFCLGPYSYVMLHDTGDSALPYRIALASTFLSGHWGYWDPQKVGGIDGLSMLVWPFQPDVILTGILPGWLAYGLMAWLQRFFAGYFTFRVLKDCADLETLPALYGGMAYSLYYQPAINGHWGGFTLDNGLLCEAGLPFILWTLSRLDPEKNLAFVSAILLGVFVSATAWLVNAVYLMPVVVLWHFIIMRKTGYRPALLSAVFLLSWALCSLPLLYPLLSNTPFSHRAAWYALPIQGNLANQDLLKFTYERLIFVAKLATDNALPLGLVVLGLTLSGTRNRLVRWTFGTGIVFMALQLAYGIIRNGIPEQLGLLRSVNFDRLYLCVPWLLIVAGSMAASHIPRDLHFQWKRKDFLPRHLPARMPVVAFSIAVVLIQSCYVNTKILYGAIHGNNFTDFYMNSELQDLSGSTSGLPPFRVVTVAQGILHPAQAWVHRLETADGYVNVYPQRYQEYWEQIMAPLFAAEPGLYDYFKHWGSRVYLFSPFYGQPDPRIWGSSPKSISLKDHYNLPLLSLANIRYVISPFPLLDEDLRQVGRNSNADEVKTWEKLGMAGKLLAYVRGDKPELPLYVYENLRYLPRFLVVNRTRLFDGVPELLQGLRKASHDDLASTAYLLRSDAVPLSNENSEPCMGKATLMQYTSDRVVVAVSCETDCILITANSYSPFWKAHVNGTSVPIFPVDHAFQGLRLPRGKAMVELEYDPPYVLKLLRGGK
jgi:hypothetical protein